MFSSKTATGSDFTHRQRFQYRECKFCPKLKGQNNDWERDKTLSGKDPCKMNKDKVDEVGPSSVMLSLL